MSILILHLAVGLLTGALFGVQTLVVLAGLALVEAVACGSLRGIDTGLALLLGAQTALQAGYLGGMFLRSLLERYGIAAAMEAERP